MGEIWKHSNCSSDPRDFRGGILRDVNLRRKILTVIARKGTKNRIALMNQDLMKTVEVWTEKGQNMQTTVSIRKKYTIAIHALSEIADEYYPLAR